MHITVLCPHCQSRFQIEPSLRGKRMRCPNPICRMIFEVREEERSAPPAPPKLEGPPPARNPVISGNVGEVVPVLPADMDIPGDDDQPWIPGPEDHAAGPLELQPGLWEPPPVRAEGRLEMTLRDVSSSADPKATLSAVSVPVGAPV